MNKLIPALGAGALILLTAGSASAAPAEETIGKASQIGQRHMYFYDNDTGSEPSGSSAVIA